MRDTVMVGAVEVVGLEDAAGPFFAPRAEAFPSVSAEQWAGADSFDPDAVNADGEWVLRFRCFAVRARGGRTILVDAGVGPADAPAASWAPVPGRLPAALDEAGIDPDGVDTVVLTHLHTDHVGWAVTGGEPYFGNARYVLQAAEVAAAEGRDAPVSHAVVAPLRAAGRLHLVDGDASLGPRIRTVATPGHTPGHQAVLVSSAQTEVLITGDLLVHAVQLLHPDVGYAYDDDRERAAAARERWLRRIGERGGTLASSHLGRAFVPVSGSPAR